MPLDAPVMITILSLNAGRVIFTSKIECADGYYNPALRLGTLLWENGNQNTFFSFFSNTNML
jgi:hypothetical protein